MANPFAVSVKFLAAINLLASPSGTTVKKLMSRLNVSRRTAFRLLDALTGMGFPLVDEQPGPRVEKTYRLIESYVVKLPNTSIPNPGFTAQEIEALLKLLDFCDDLRQPEKTMLFNSIRQKITAITANADDGTEKDQRK
jgi:predicted DNA-binding transcriptional regulator YafY